jgi:hypothetical protein
MQQAGASAQEEVQIEVEEGRKQYLDLQADLPQAQEEGQRCSRPLPSPGPWSGAVGTEECAPWQPMLLSCVFKSERIVLSADRPHRLSCKGYRMGRTSLFFCKPPARFQWQRGHLGSWTSGWFPCQHCSPTAAQTRARGHPLRSGAMDAGSLRETTTCPGNLSMCQGSQQALLVSSST